MAQRGSTQRLFLTAYNIAAKYIHSNLGAVIAASSLLRNRIKGAATDLPRPETRRLQQASVVKTPPTTTTPRHVPQPLKFSSTEAPISPPPTPTHIPPRPTPYPQSQHRRTPEPYLHPPSQILTHTTAQLAMLLPRTTVQELTKMELEFLHFLDYDLTVHSSAELMGWWERCVGIDRLQIVPDCRAEDSIRDEISDTGSRTDDDEVVPNLWALFWNANILFLFLLSPFLFFFFVNNSLSITFSIIVTIILLFTTSDSFSTGNLCTYPPFFSFIRCR